MILMPFKIAYGEMVTGRWEELKEPCVVGEKEQGDPLRLATPEVPAARFDVTCNG